MASPRPLPLPAGRQACLPGALGGHPGGVRRGPDPSWGDKVRSHSVGQATGRTAWRGQRQGGARGPALSARPGTPGRRHLSRSEAGGPRGPAGRTRGSGSSLADSPCSRRASPPGAATRSAAGRRSRPRWPRRRPRSPCRRRRRAADGRELAGSSRPAHVGVALLGGAWSAVDGGVASRRGVAAEFPSVPAMVTGGRNLEPRLRCQGGAGEVCPA